MRSLEKFSEKLLDRLIDLAEGCPHGDDITLIAVEVMIRVLSESP